ncbi:MAG: hypothetical protein H7A25_07585 [Leptospiraceae bacterium]|nr:hypothetical protein [Leptospiraceae bacterium]MCP5499746.1 hypothetical protein [Leptospiraceae bacterium]
MKRRFKLLFIKNFAISIRLFFKSLVIGAGLTAGFLSVSLLAIAVNNVSVKTDWTSGSTLTSTDLNNIGNGINVIKTAIEGIPNWMKGTTTTDAVYTDGNVGIGTSSPAEKLDVNGNISWNVPWIDVTSLGSGVSCANIGWIKCQYRKIGDIVYMRGLAIKTGSNFATDDIILTLPAGYRPYGVVSYPVIAHTGNAVHRVDIIGTDGTVKIGASANSIYAELDVIQFSTSP